MNKMRKIFLVLMIAVALALAITACKDEEEDDPPVETEKAQHSPNTPMFAGKTATITTTDTFTDTQWNAIVTEIVGKFSTGYDVGNAEYKNFYEQAFTNNITIIVEKNPTGYTNYKYTRSNKTLYVKANGGAAVLDADDIVSAILGAQDRLDK